MAATFLGQVSYNSRVVIVCIEVFSGVLLKHISTNCMYWIISSIFAESVSSGKKVSRQWRNIVCKRWSNILFRIQILCASEEKLLCTCAKIFASIGDGQRKPDPSALPRQRLQAGGPRTGESSPYHRHHRRHRRFRCHHKMTTTVLRHTVVLRRTSLARFSLEMFT